MNVLVNSKICDENEFFNNFKVYKEWPLPKVDNDVVVVAFQEDATVFVGAADQVDDYKFGLLDAEAAGELGVEQGQIVLLKSFDEGHGLRIFGDNFKSTENSNGTYITKK